MTYKPITLGDKLASFQTKNKQLHFGARLSNTLSSLFNFALVFSIVALVFWELLGRPDLKGSTTFIILIVVTVVWLFTVIPRKFQKKDLIHRQHPLLANDKQGFMSRIRLDAKTVIFDGSNIYHFGYNKGLGARPLGLIAHQLRAEGYRIVCFFDANIFYTLSERAAFPKNQPHSTTLLGNIFGLAIDEIYVVPSGIQADQYILDSLTQLPISFAVTNDLFRDYVSKYPTVMKDNHWRKGVEFSDNEITLLQHRLKKPIRL